MGAKDVADRWLKARRAMKAEDQVYAVKLAGMAKKHSSEAFYAFNDPLEAAVFSVLVEMMKEIKELEVRKNTESLRANLDRSVER
jgi:hypothetical protein